jgi:uncharacterized protein
MQSNIRSMRLRASSYNIYVDLPGQDEMLLVHGYLGSYDRVSRRVATYLHSLDPKPPKPLYGDWTPETVDTDEIVVPSPSTIDALKRRGYLTEKTVDEEEAYFSEVATKLHNLSSLRKTSYIFMPTYNCNLRCFYCFQDHMRTKPEFKHLLHTMQPEVVDQIFDAIPKIDKLHGWDEKHGQPRRRLGFFGGEPLLEENYPIVKYIMEKAASMGGATFNAITNGTDLHIYRELLGEGLNRISSIQITLDGPKHEHDQRRIYADKSGSFERIAHNITMALDLGVHVSVRMNIDRNNIKDLPELAREIVQRKWDAYTNFSAYVAPIHAANENTEKKTTFNAWTLQKAVDDLRTQEPAMRVISHPDDGMKHRALQIFKGDEAMQDPIRLMNASFCGAHTGMYLFDAFGDIYACWERTGDKQIRIGHIQDGNVLFNDAINSSYSDSGRHCVCDLATGSVES